MSDEAENTRKVLAACREWNETKGGSIDTWLDLFAQDGVLTSAAGGRAGVEFSAPVKGRAELHRYLTALTNDWAMLYYNMTEAMAQGDRVVVWGEISYRNRASDKDFVSRKIDLWRFENGHAVDYYESFDTAALLAALP